MFIILGADKKSLESQVARLHYHHLINICCAGLSSVQESWRHWRKALSDMWYPDPLTWDWDKVQSYMFWVLYSHVLRSKNLSWHYFKFFSKTCISPLNFLQYINSVLLWTLEQYIQMCRMGFVVYWGLRLSFSQLNSQ